MDIRGGGGREGGREGGRWGENVLNIIVEGVGKEC